MQMVNLGGFFGWWGDYLLGRGAEWETISVTIATASREK